MIRVFLDANILVSVLNKEYPLFPFSARLLSLADNPKYQLYTSPMCLAIAFYFAEKKNKMNANKKIQMLCNHISIANNTKEAVLATINNVKINDFEDGLEYYAALDTNCNFIVTEDIHDFYFSEIEVVKCKDFMERHLLSS